MWLEFDERQQEMHFFTGGSVIMDYGLWFEVKNVLKGSWNAFSKYYFVLFSNVFWGALIILMFFVFLSSKAVITVIFYPEFNLWFECSVGRDSVGERLQWKRPLLWLANIFAYEMSITCGTLSKTLTAFLMLSWKVLSSIIIRTTSVASRLQPNTACCLQKKLLSS